jgi:hypothetical protein
LLRLDADADYFAQTFVHMSQAQTFEHAVLVLPWSYWQYRLASGCADIPSADAPVDELYAFLKTTSGFATDDSLAPFRPYYYQAATQVGWPLIDESQLVDLERFPGTHTAATYAAPLDVPLVYDGQLMPELRDWVASTGERVLLVYGANDPWAAALLDVDAAHDSLRFIVPGGNHYAHLADLGAEPRGVAVDALERWLGLPGGLEPPRAHPQAGDRRRR